MVYFGTTSLSGESKTGTRTSAEMVARSDQIESHDSIPGGIDGVNDKSTAPIISVAEWSALSTHSDALWATSAEPSLVIRRVRPLLDYAVS